MAENLAFFALYARRHVDGPVLASLTAAVSAGIAAGHFAGRIRRLGHAAEAVAHAADCAGLRGPKCEAELVGCRGTVSYTLRRCDGEGAELVDACVSCAALAVEAGLYEYTDADDADVAAREGR